MCAYQRVVIILRIPRSEKSDANEGDGCTESRSCAFAMRWPIAKTSLRGLLKYPDSTRVQMSLDLFHRAPKMGNAARKSSDENLMVAAAHRKPFGS